MLKLTFALLLRNPHQLMSDALSNWVMLKK